MGLCNITPLEKIIENEYSLNPGRYVGFKINIDESFDYKKRLKEIDTEMKSLDERSIKLKKMIDILKL